MDVKQIIQNLFQTNEFQLTKTNKGLTNQNYFLCINNEQYMVRVPYQDSDHIVERDHELAAMEAVKGHDLDVDCIYFDGKTGIKITTFIENLKEFGEADIDDKIERTAVLMKRLHSLKLQVPYEFKPVKRLHQYASHIQNPLFDLSKEMKISEKIETVSQNLILCHNDWVSGNILLGNKKDYLIDYEYAANNDPLFDVMSFLTENQIGDKKLRQRFYDVYFESFNDELQEKLNLWENFHNLLWCNWAMMMWESRNEIVYKKIAEEKYNALLKQKY